ncbi:hypothetical protein, conserved [Babesia ovata]|uniref:Uncharacterized protein n=1 Tax=Babesia ovata TaxID=189622 RepID=A0A2H6KGG3_9APIC|nr:uncharacterized protein BOVATA_035830 [Babesia ovata]GBE62090.1 hypothetical protein, conserved [Babesia ovata]
MVYDSLTEAPRNLKEGIDWLMALRGKDGEKNLAAMGAAVYKFLADKPVGFMEVPALDELKSISKKFMEKKELRDLPFVRKLLGKFAWKVSKRVSSFHKKFGSIAESDWENVIETRGVKPEDIAADLAKAVYGCARFLAHIKNPDKYESAYSSNATWDASCAKDPEACAVVLVGVAPMLYTGLRSLKDTSLDIVNRHRPSKCAEFRLGCLIKAVGYEEPGCRTSVSGSVIFKAFGAINRRILTIFYDLAGFWAFYGFEKVGDMIVEVPRGTA